jgi:Fis family transcriptional regulator
MSAAPTKPSAAASDYGESALAQCVTQLVRRYLRDLDGNADGAELHMLVMHSAEAPLLREVMAWHGGNQSRAAATLGINRATLRKKLGQHGLE